MNQLDDFFDAYDRTHSLAGDAPDWDSQRKKVRRALARPVYELVGKVALALLCLAWGILGHPNGYLLAVGILLFLPGYYGRVRSKAEDIAALSSEDELKALLEKERTRRLAKAVVGALYWAALALLLFLFAGFLAWKEKDFRPSLAVGGIAVLLCAWEAFFRFPRLCRGMADLEDEDDDEDSAPEEADGN